MPSGLLILASDLHFPRLPHAAFSMNFQSEGPVIGTTAARAVAQDFNALASNLGPESTFPALPTGMPSHLDHALAWSSADFTHEAHYVCMLTVADLAEINAALASFKGE